jgi:hypothetical protein
VGQSGFEREVSLLLKRLTRIQTPYLPPRAIAKRNVAIVVVHDCMYKGVGQTSDPLVGGLGVEAEPAHRHHDAMVIHMQQCQVALMQSAITIVSQVIL